MTETTSVQARGIAAPAPSGRVGGVVPPRQHRGQLRIYLGSAAGVGKTYAMLGEGHRRQERGTEVVVAFVETHGREHTAALLDGMEIMPRAKLAYRGRGPAAGSPARAGWPATPW